MLFLMIYLTIGAVYLAASYAFIRIVLDKTIKEKRDIRSTMFLMLIVVKLFLWPYDLIVIIRAIMLLKSQDTKYEMEMRCEEAYETLFDERA